MNNTHTHLAFLLGLALLCTMNLLAPAQDAAPGEGRYFVATNGNDAWSGRLAAPNAAAKNPYGGGWAYADGKTVPMYADVPGEDRRTFQYKTQDARPWAHPEEGEAFVFPRFNWWNNIVRIASVDREQRKITLASDA